MRHQIFFILSFFLVFALILSNHEASAIDLNPLKIRSTSSHSVARTNNNVNNNNNNNNNNNRIVADASTGTVTALAPGTEKEPVTCNEIMAKAVVIASEEKEAAIADRNDALLQATQATHIAQELKSKIDAALQEAKNATIEYEAMKLMTNQLVDQAQEDASLKIQDLLEQTHLEIKEANDLHVLLKKDMELQHRLAMDEMKLLSRQEKEATNQQIKSIQQESQEEINRAYSDAKIRVNEALDRSHQIETDSQEMAESAMRNADSLISDMQRNLKYQVQEGKDQCTATVNQANEYYTNVLKDLEVKQQAFADSAAMNEASRVLELTEQCAAQTTQLSTIINDLEVKHSDLVSAAAMNDAALGSNIQTQANAITALEQVNTHLTKDLNDANQQLKYWMELHDNQKMVNATLFMMHSRAVTDRSVVFAEQKAKAGYDILAQHARDISEQIQSRSQPHLEKVHDIYKVHLQKTVDSDIIPFYERYVVPLQHRVQKKVKENLAPISVKCHQKGREIMAIAKDYSRQQFERLCRLVQVKATIVIQFLQSDQVQTEVNVAVSESLIAVLVGIEQDSTMFVSVLLKIVAVFIIYKSRYAILTLVLWLCLLPLRMAWYLCPLRLLFQGRKGSTSTSAGASASASKKKVNGSNKGNAKKAAIKKEKKGHEKND